MERINATDFKARCLAILDRVHETGEREVILKRGRPVAELTRPSGEENRYPQADLEGTVVILGDVVEPVFPEEHWDSLKRRMPCSTRTSCSGGMGTATGCPGTSRMR